MTRVFTLMLLILLALTACQPVDLNAPAPRFDTGIDVDAWARVPAGEFLQGQFDHSVEIAYDYEMMVTDVTNAQYAAFLTAALADGSAVLRGTEVVGFYPGDPFHAGRHEEPIPAGEYLYLPVDDPALRLSSDGDNFTARAPWGDHPVTMVSWFGAKAYCEYYGWRLPTELEWEKAARGVDGRPFPWGEAIAPENANYISSRDPFEDMRQFGSRTTPVGFYNGTDYAGYLTLDSPSPYGLYDMAGNVWQWTADIYPEQHYRYLRGGSKDGYENTLRVWVRNSATPTYVSPGAGFRCARDPVSASSGARTGL